MNGHPRPGRPRALGALLTATLLAPALAQQPGYGQQPTSPHRELRGLACTSCHGTDSWREIRFDHRRTRFPLRGQHLAAPCGGCHDLRDFRTAVRACGSCHQDTHRGDAGISCERCHTEVGWRIVNPQDAHARSRLPDLGVHAALRCEDCHRTTGAQQFHGAVSRCVACHQQTYDATNNPSHRALGFGTTCDACHQMATWRFALFAQHDAIFGIYRGAHAGVWSSCASCHPSSADYRVFTCTTCHTQARTDAAHSGITGFQWQSAACLTCHPQGGGADLSLHDAVFPIFSGPHAGQWTACTDCHADPVNRRVISCLTGYCHAQPATDAAHLGIPGYAYATAQCRTCHPDGRAGTFAQHDAIFPIYSGTHANRWQSCATCHPDPTSRSIFTCAGAGCHQQAQMDEEHRGITGYRFDPVACLSCHPNGRKP